jgi:hypothetical protein
LSGLSGLSGCSTFHSGSESGIKWSRPTKPVLNKVKFDTALNGYFLSYTNATILANNIDELKAYIQKLEVLVDAMEKK